MLGPSGTGKSVFLKSLVGLLKPERGSIVMTDVDIVSCSERQLYDVGACSASSSRTARCSAR